MPPQQNEQNIIETLSLKIIEHDNDFKAMRKTLHDINNNLMNLKNPMIKVRNGQEKTMSYYDAIGEMWERNYKNEKMIEEIKNTLDNEIKTSINNIKFVKFPDADGDVVNLDLNTAIGKLAKRPKRSFDKTVYYASGMWRILQFLQTIGIFGIIYYLLKK